MNLTKRSSGIFKRGFKAKTQSSIAIGGMDEGLLEERKTLIDEMAQEAEQKANKKIEELTQNAQKEADKIIAKAQKEAENIEKQAYDQGYQAGQEQAKQDCEEEVTATLTELAAILKAVEKEREETLKDETTHVYKTIVLICKKLLNKELETSKLLCLNFIKRALSELDYKTRLNLTVSPKIGEALDRNRFKLLSEHPEIKQLIINTDANLGNGDLIVEANKERLDHRLETKLEQLLAEITKQ